METKQVTFCKSLFFILGTQEKMSVINNSNLTEREKSALIQRYVKGYPIKQVSSDMGMEIEAYNKMQKKAFFKMYSWLQRNAKNCGLLIENPTIKES